jgi:hypothetical protein
MVLRPLLVAFLLVSSTATQHWPGYEYGNSWYGSPWYNPYAYDWRRYNLRDH